MKSLIRELLTHKLIAESQKTEYEFQVRDIGGGDVYYKRKKGSKIWDFIDEKEFTKNSTKDNTIKFKK